MTDDEKEQKEAQLVRDFLANATPEQRHLFIARSNYDCNYDALNELAADPQLDRASALLMYWSLGAAWYVQYGHDDDVPDYSRHSLALIRLIETRYSAGFYADHGIWFDPMQSEAEGRMITLICRSDGLYLTSCASPHPVMCMLIWMMRIMMKAYHYRWQNRCMHSMNSIC